MPGSLPKPEQATRILLSRLAGLGPAPHAIARRLADRLPGPFAPRAGHRQVDSDLTTWHLDLADNLQRTLYFTGAYEPASVEGVCSRLRSGDLVMDVGANIGAFSVPVWRRLQGLGGGTVIAIEPLSTARHRLAEHLDQSDEVVSVRVVDRAFSDRHGSVELRQNPSFQSGDLGTASMHATGSLIESVDCLPGAAWCDENGVERIDVLKVDVEGAELAVLQGLYPLLEAHPPRVAHIEVVDAHMSGSGRFEVFEIMRTLGLAGYWCNGLGLRPATPDDGRSGNALFLADG